MSSPPDRRSPARRVELAEGVREHHPSGQVAVCRRDRLESEIVAQGEKLGFVRVATTALRPLSAEDEELGEFLEQGRHGVMSYLGQLAPDGRRYRLDPRLLMAGAQSAIIVALPYAPMPTRGRRPADGPKLVGRVANYAGGRDYHAVIKERLLLLSDVIADLKGAVVRCRACVDTAPVLERQLARDAGFAFLGKNTLAIVPGVGSSFNLGVLLVDLELRPAQPSLASGCGSCRECLRACPTGALDDEHRIDARRCISYLTIEYRGIIPRDLRALMGTWVFGCDICQDVCPYNAAKGVPDADPELVRSDFWQSPALIELLTLSSSAYKRHVRRTALKRVDRAQLVRNAAIALGNVAAVEAAPALSEVARRFAHLPARVHATWALGRIGETHRLPGAREVLEELLSDEEPEVRKEAALALATVESGDERPPKRP